MVNGPVILLGVAGLLCLASLRFLRPKGSTDQVTLRGRSWEWAKPGPAVAGVGLALALLGAAWLLLS